MFIFSCYVSYDAHYEIKEEMVMINGKHVSALLVMMLTATALAFPKTVKKPKPLPLGGVSFGMTTKELKAAAKKKRRNLIGPSKGLISHKEMVPVQEYATDKDRQLVTVSGAKTQTFMLSNSKLVGVKLLFTSSSSLKYYIKNFEKAGFTKSGTDYEGTVQVGDLAGRKVLVLVTPITVNRRTKYTVTISCLEVFGKGVTADKVNAAMKKAGAVGRQVEDTDDKKGIGGVL
jgi:hypothetical protein